MSILIAEDLAKQYNSRKVVKNLSINVKSGEIVGLLGPNGAGKTTAFYMIVGLTSCQRGRISIDDNNLTSLPMHQRAQLGLGYLPQEASIFRKLTVEQNILAVLQIQPDLKTAGIEEILERLLNQMNINDLRNSLGISLSGGERRRVEIARTLATRPKFILLDEPFAGVDPISVLDIQRIIKDLAKKDIGVLITDHNVRETLGICTKGYVINEGLVIASGTPEQILDNKEVKKVYLGEEFRM
ncbi:MAG: LPS export ABC transporter ATP-binding protein [Gammaproteobacteria bacterium]|nr:LPS export ABC transporter ATP-binding protein [Gammaproteobacteria bacterium]